MTILQRKRKCKSPWTSVDGTSHKARIGELITESLPGIPVHAIPKFHPDTKHRTMKDDNYLLERNSLLAHYSKNKRLVSCSPLRRRQKCPLLSAVSARSNRTCQQVFHVIFGVLDKDTWACCCAKNQAAWLANTAATVSADIRRLGSVA
jgi:hypothetical protein